MNAWYDSVAPSIGPRTSVIRADRERTSATIDSIASLIARLSRSCCPTVVSVRVVVITAPYFGHPAALDERFGVGASGRGYAPPVSGASVLSRWISTASSLHRSTRLGSSIHSLEV